MKHHGPRLTGNLYGDNFFKRRNGLNGVAYLIRVEHQGFVVHLCAVVNFHVKVGKRVAQNLLHQLIHKKRERDRSHEIGTAIGDGLQYCTIAIDRLDHY